MQFRSAADINPTPEQVWAVLVDGPECTIRVSGVDKFANGFKERAESG